MKTARAVRTLRSNDELENTMSKPKNNTRRAVVAAREQTTLDRSTSTTVDLGDQRDPAAEGRRAAAEHLGREVALDHLTPAQRERAAKRFDAGTDTADRSTEAGSALEAGRAFALDHLSPEQRRRAAERLDKRDRDE